MNSVQQQPQNQQQPRPSFIEQMMPFVFLFALVYFAFIRPSQKRIQRHNEFTLKIKKGDKVLTSSGILGTVDGLTENYVTLEVADKVKIKVLRNQISSYLEEKKETSRKPR